MNKDLPPELYSELKKKLSLIRLAKTGFFKKAEIPHPSIASELILHRAVLDKALIDSFNPKFEIRNEVEEWLDLTNPDFIEACSRAMLSPKGVYDSFKLFKKLLRGKNARFNGFSTRVQKDS
jgi:hypothetical protein